MAVLNFVAEHWSELLNGLVGIFVAGIAFFMIIPGEEPEATLQKIVDFIKKFSVK